MKDIFTIITPMLLVILGFIFNRQLEKYREEIGRLNRDKENYRSLKITYYEKKLTTFLNPLLNAIEFDNFAWKRISTISSDLSAYPDDISSKLEEKYILANHKKAVDLVRQNLHFVELNSDFHRSLLSYMRHVALYETLRDLKKKLNPIDLGDPFPDDLEILLRIEYEKTLKKHNALLKIS